jgi:hypothetical protein
MWLSMRRVTIFAFALLFVCGSIFSAPKRKVVEPKKTDAVEQTSESTVKKQVPAEGSTTNRNPVPSTTIPAESAPAVVAPVTPTTTPAAAPVATTSEVAVYSIDWFVIAAGGGSGTSTNYALSGTVGQTAVGEGTSTNYTVNAGFWQNFAPAGCCVGIRGNVNGDGAVNPNILDLNFLVNYIFRLSGNPGPCLDESNANGDGAVNPNILDLNFLVNYIFRFGPLPGPCP